MHDRFADDCARGRLDLRARGLRRRQHDLGDRDAAVRGRPRHAPDIGRDLAGRARAHRRCAAGPGHRPGRRHVAAHPGHLGRRRLRRRGHRPVGGLRRPGQLHANRRRDGHALRRQPRRRRRHDRGPRDRDAEWGLELGHHHGDGSGHRRPGRDHATCGSGDDAGRPDADRHHRLVDRESGRLRIPVVAVLGERHPLHVGRRRHRPAVPAHRRRRRRHARGSGDRIGAGSRRRAAVFPGQRAGRPRRHHRPGDHRGGPGRDDADAASGGVGRRGRHDHRRRVAALRLLRRLRGHRGRRHDLCGHPHRRR